MKKIGDVIKINHQLKRNRNKTKRFWDKISIKEQKAIFLGMRYLSNGIVEEEELDIFGGGKTISYKREKTVFAALVKTFDNKNPFYIEIQRS